MGFVWPDAVTVDCHYEQENQCCRPQDGYYYERDQHVGVLELTCAGLEGKVGGVCVRVELFGCVDDQQDGRDHHQDHLQLEEGQSGVSGVVQSEADEQRYL